MARRRGWQRQHITAIAAFNAQGQARKPALLWNTKKKRRHVPPCTVPSDTERNARWVVLSRGLPGVGGNSTRERNTTTQQPSEMHFVTGGWQQNAPHTAGSAKNEVLGCRRGCVPPPSDRCHPATRQSRFQGTEGLVWQKGRTLEKEKPSQTPVPCRLCGTVDRCIC